jgi:hypothetical protein
MTHEELREKAKLAWKKHRNNQRLEQSDKDVLIDAYWASVLPVDSDYDVGQWVEDGFPEL